MTQFQRFARLSILLLVVPLFLSCAWFGDDEEEDEFAGLSSEEQFYQRALDQLTNQNFRGSISTYEALESRFPFGRFAEQAQIEIVYAYYRSGDREAARAAAQRFIRLHPDSGQYRLRLLHAGTRFVRRQQRISRPLRAHRSDQARPRPHRRILQ